ncbi:programmed cell death protein 10 isoform X2 [Diprion similis]|uniref:programmed cell death protein 10 isoform X2 n=1 Tax=Diprion similis TaxID=362088 RepID=UPI001EF88AE4|nr:programmed cell death protein 10 isoform X2 [Diprion similis]
MTMGDETPVTSLVLPVILRPILSKLERQNVSAAQTLRAALSKAENSHPGVTHDLVLGIVRRADLNLNMNESILRLQGVASDIDVEYRLARSEDAFQELNRKSASLKKILSRIPDEITDRKTFLETIKEIASAIKKLLDAVNEVAGFIPGSAGKQALEQRKREFVKYSKRFSNTLKEYFKEGHLPHFLQSKRSLCECTLLDSSDEYDHGYSQE